MKERTAFNISIRYQGALYLIADNAFKCKNRNVDLKTVTTHVNNQD